MDLLNNSKFKDNIKKIFSKIPSYKVEDDKKKDIINDIFSEILLYKIKDDKEEDITKNFPFINGKLHYGYVCLMTINSILFNYHAMNNCYFPIKLFPETQNDLFLKKINFTNNIKNIEISEFKEHYDLYINKFIVSYGNMKQFSDFNSIFFKRYIENLDSGIVFNENSIEVTRKINFEDYNKNINDYIIDIIRLFFLNNDLKHTCFFLRGKKHIIYTLTKRIERYNNCINLFKKTVTIYQSVYSEIDFDKPFRLINIFDQYIILKLNDLKKKINENFSKKNINKNEIVHWLTEFIFIISRLYINKNKITLYGQYNKHEWKNSIKVLYYVLLEYCKLLAPIMPNISEYIFQSIKIYSKKHNSLEFVLLNKYPQYEELDLDKEEIYKAIKYLYDIDKYNLKIRLQYRKKYIPWECMIIYNNNEKFKDIINKNIYIIKGNLNTLNIKYESFKQFKDDERFYNINISNKKKNENCILSISKNNNCDIFNLGNINKLENIIKSFLINKKIINYKKNKIRIFIDYNYPINHYLLKNNSLFNNEEMKKIFNLQIIQFDFNNDIVLDDDPIKICDNGIKDEFIFKDKYNICKLICEVENIKKYLCVIINEI